MPITKNIQDIIGLKNYCKSMIQELYHYETRPYGAFTNISAEKIDEAIQLEIIEYDDFDDVLSLSADTEEYYRVRLGQGSETNIGFIGEKLTKLKDLLKVYNIRIKNNEDTTRDIRLIYRLLNQIPSTLRQNLKALSSNSIFAFKNEPNFEIKIINLEICRKEIQELSLSLEDVDKFLDEQWNFFKSIENTKINFVIRKLRRTSAGLEKSFAKLHSEIISFINQSIKDGAFIEKMKKLKELKEDNTLLSSTNIEAIAIKKLPIIKSIKTKKILPDDRVYDYIESIQDILKSRQNKVLSTKKIVAIEYDILQQTTTSKVLYDYVKLNRTFLAQKSDLITFLCSCDIEEKKLLGVFVRLLKNYAAYYDVGQKRREHFICVNDRMFLKVFSGKKGEQNVD